MRAPRTASTMTAMTKAIIVPVLSAFGSQCTNNTSLGWCAMPQGGRPAAAGAASGWIASTGPAPPLSATAAARRAHLPLAGDGHAEADRCEKPDHGHDPIEVQVGADLGVVGGGLLIQSGHVPAPDLDIDQIPSLWCFRLVDGRDVVATEFRERDVKRRRARVIL